MGETIRTRSPLVDSANRRPLAIEPILVQRPMFRSDRDKNGPAVRRILASGHRTLIHRREVRGVLREVFLTDDGHVLKRYSHNGPPPRFRQPWIMEYRALHRLAGRGAPRVIGYVTETTDRGVRAILARRFLPGDAIGAVDPALATAIAALLATFHCDGVTTDDAHLQNFIRLPEGGLAFLDFGRARTFFPWSPLLLAGIAVDLHRFLRASVKSDSQIRRRFLDEYFRQCPFGPIRRSLIRRLVAFDMWRYRLVKGTGRLQA